MSQTSIIENVKRADIKSFNKPFQPDVRCIKKYVYCRNSKDKMLSYDGIFQTNWYKKLQWIRWSNEKEGVFYNYFIKNYHQLIINNQSYNPMFYFYFTSPFIYCFFYRVVLSYYYHIYIFCLYMLYNYMVFFLCLYITSNTINY